MEQSVEREMQLTKDMKPKLSEEDDKLPESATVKSNAWVLNTTFTVPIIRFNFLENQQLSQERNKGNVNFFNSIGAGLGIGFGRLTETTNAERKIINTEMDNVIGVQLGFLFASNATSSNRTNIFAGTAAISVLNFQLGYGYEFGSVGLNEKRGFLTLAYGIPVSKLVRGGFFVIEKEVKANPKSYFSTQ
jgi:hypothetical protein